MKPGFIPRLLVAVAAALLLPACVTNPVTGQSQFSLVSEEDEIRLGGAQYQPMIQESYGAVNDPALQAYVQRVGSSLAAVSHRPGLDYRFTVVNANIDNAFALPGGKICITRGLLARMTNEDQLAGVLGHETGHVAARHSAQALTRQTLTQGVFAVPSAVSGGTAVGDLALSVAGAGAQLVFLRYSRDQERQADDLGMEYMTKAGYNPKGFVESMRILKAGHEREPSKFDAMFQSHPVTGERITTGEERLKTVYAPVTARPEKADEFARATQQLKAEIPAFRLADEGQKALSEKRYRDAARLFAEAAQNAPRQAIHPALGAISWLMAREDEEALACARAAVALDPGHFYGRLAGGVAAHKRKLWEESNEDLLGAEKTTGPTLGTTFLIGRNFEELGKRDEAAKRFRLIVDNVASGREREYALRRLVEWGYPG